MERSPSWHCWEENTTVKWESDQRQSLLKNIYQCFSNLRTFLYVPKSFWSSYNLQEWRYPPPALCKRKSGLSVPVHKQTYKQTDLVILSKPICASGEAPDTFCLQNMHFEFVQIKTTTNKNEVTRGFNNSVNSENLPKLEGFILINPFGCQPTHLIKKKCFYNILKIRPNQSAVKYVFK